MHTLKRWFSVCNGALAALVLFWPLTTTAAASHASYPSFGSQASVVSAFYMFRSWSDPNKVVFILNMPPRLESSDGAMFSSFPEELVYRINIDNDGDGVANNLVYEVRFHTERQTALGVKSFPFPYVGGPSLSNPNWRGITALDGPGSEGLVLRQAYTVTEIRGSKAESLFRDQQMIAVPPNVGPSTMPAYEALAAQGIYTDSRSAIRVFAGPRAETFYGDTGALFDSANLRRMPPFLSATEDNNNFASPFGVNRFKGVNVNVIAIEVPISRITRDGKPPELTAAPLIGAYGSILSRANDSDRWEAWGKRAENKKLLQISRMGNPSFRAVVVDAASKEGWDASLPENDAQFQDFLKDPAFSQLLADVTGLPVPPPPRLELVGIIFKYPGQLLNGTDCGSPCADLLRLNLLAPPTPPELQHRLGALLSPDQAGLPNGRRPNDDVIDITLRAFGGPAYFAARIGDGVNFLDGAPGAGVSDGPGYGQIPGNRLDVTVNGIAKEFPFMPTPYDWFNH